MDLNMDLVDSIGKMAQFMKGILYGIISKELENINGLMGKCTKVNGNIINAMEKVKIVLIVK